MATRKLYSLPSQDTMESNVRDAYGLGKDVFMDVEHPIRGLVNHVAALWETLLAHHQKLERVDAITYEAGGMLVIKVGAASITVKKDGTIDISGNRITVNGNSDIRITATGDLVLKGSKINQN